MTGPEVIVFPDVEQLLVEWLPGRLQAAGITVTVVTAVPSPRPAEFVRVLRVGGTAAEFYRDRATMLVEAWAGLESRAYEIAAVCRGLINALPGFDIGGYPPVYKVEEASGPANLPDPTSAQHRYTATYALHVRGVAA